MRLPCYSFEWLRRAPIRQRGTERRMWDQREQETREETVRNINIFLLARSDLKGIARGLKQV